MPVQKNSNLRLKLRLFLPVSVIIIAVVTAITIWFVNRSISTFNEQIEKNLILETETIYKMVERESDLKIEKVKSNIKVAEAILGSSNLDFTGKEIIVKAENQDNGLTYDAKIKNWTLNGEELYDNHKFVDSLKNLLGSMFTIFQRTDSGFIRISTNVFKTDESRATGTFIPITSNVCQSVLNTGIYYGRAFVVNDWQVSAYLPIMNGKEVVGMIYTGDKEKDLGELKRILGSLKIGKSGYPFIFDGEGNFIIHPIQEGQNFSDSSVFMQLKGKESGVFRYDYNGVSKTISFRYFPGYELYVAASVINEEETKELKQDAITGAAIIAVAAILLLLIPLYYFTGERIFRYFSEMQRSRRKLVIVSQELEASEERFTKLFDSTGDDIFVTNIHETIVEVNNAACETLGYPKNELVGKKITDIKSDKAKVKVAENRRIIYEKGNYVFESEHVTKDGKVIPVEFLSKLVTYGNERLILSVVRNLSQRRELERQILSAVIMAEEKERQRFAKDMHDGLGPLLSTIKLYVNELSSSTISDVERKELIRQSNELIDDAVNQTRNISNNIMPRVIHQYGLVKAVEAFCEKVNRTNQLAISFETENFERPDQNLELILFRIISELINNTIKHAQAKTVMIMLIRNNDTLSLYFKDDGIGFNMDEIMNSEYKGTGIKNIISRVKSINGTYYFNSIPGEGFTMKAEIKI